MVHLFFTNTSEISDVRGIFRRFAGALRLELFRQLNQLRYFADLFFERLSGELATHLELHRFRGSKLYRFATINEKERCQQ